jgi:hypothetical protein
MTSTIQVLPHSQNGTIIWSREVAPSKRSSQRGGSDDDYDDELYPNNCAESHRFKDDELKDTAHYRSDDDALYYQGDFHDEESRMEYSPDSNNFDVQNNHYNDLYNEQYFNQLNINQVPPPPSLFEEYDADDEYYLEVEMPVRQISIQEKEDIDEDVSLEYSEDGSQDRIYSRGTKPSLEHYEENSPQDVIHRIETVMGHLVNYLSKLEGPVLHEYKDPYSDDQSMDSVSSDFFSEILKYNASTFKQFDNMARQRVFTSITLVMSFIHTLLLSNRTTTTREVYYVFVTHFRNQKECDSAILDVARCLGVPRRALGLSASPKGKLLRCMMIQSIITTMV